MPILLLLLLALLGGCRQAPPEPPRADFAAELAGGRRYADRLAARHDTVSDAEVIAAGYLERLRLGLGSPFRLMEYALRDPRLPASTRGAVAWALLDATAAGRAYAVDPRALAELGRDGAARGPAAGRLHAALIARAVDGAADPREGELAVREAYRLAAAEHAVLPSAPFLAASAAALVRDRAFARRDARRLLAHASGTSSHPLALVPAWRAARRFDVEAPPGAPRPAAVEEAAATRAAALVEEVRAIPARLARGEDALADGLEPRIGRVAARRLSELARGPGAHPTQAAVWIAVRRYDDELRRAARGEGARARVARLRERARNEEAFAAELALADTGGAVRDVAARVALETALALRPYAQEPVWHPGFPAPSDADLARRFGLRSVTFDAEVPLAWRPYYRLALAGALGALEEVLPGLDVRGAAFRVGRTGREGRALAIHDPHGRAVHLPPESGVGAIAHEVGHDLDWQVARDRYGTRAAYGTELAVRRDLADPFATAVRRMPPPPELPAGDGEEPPPYAARPAELFARAFDGYVAAMLALRGRSSGYLTAAQDDFFAGHGIALGPGAGGEGGGAFVELLDHASPLPEALRRELLLRWGPGRVPGALEIHARVLPDDPGPAPRAFRAGRAPQMTAVVARGAAVREEVAEVERTRMAAVERWAARACARPLEAHGPRGRAAVEAAARAAAEARVRGILLRHARAVGFEAPPAWLRELWLGTAAREVAPLPPPLRHPLAPAAEAAGGCGAGVPVAMSGR